MQYKIPAMVDYPRAIKDELSFAGEHLKRGRHKIHPYPAMLHPLLVDSLLERYAKKDDVVFDPFCGSGVTLLQSSIKTNRSFGFDINPLALLIAKAKTQQYNIKKLTKEFLNLRGKIQKNTEVSIPNIKNIDYWYTKDAIQDLGKIRYVLKNSNYQYKCFFITTFAFICRHQSLTRKGEFKRHRIKKEKIALVDNQILARFFEHTEKMIKEFEASSIPRRPSKPILANSETDIHKDIKYDLVITSPPYGDSRTTVAYGEYSSFGSGWTDDLHMFGSVNYKVDKEGLGKARPINQELYQHKILVAILAKIQAEDKKRAIDVLHFFNGYYNAIRNIGRNLNRTGSVCFVVGNRNVKGHQIPMDQITASFFEGIGLSFESIFVRDIHNKVMPSLNSPSNKVGEKASTMANEYIVVFHKQ